MSSYAYVNTVSTNDVSIARLKVLTEFANSGELQSEIWFASDHRAIVSVSLDMIVEPYCGFESLSRRHWGFRLLSIQPRTPLKIRIFFRVSGPGESVRLQESCFSGPGERLFLYGLYTIQKR